MRAPFVITSKGRLIDKPITEIERLTSYIESAMASFVGVTATGVTATTTFYSGLYK